LEFVEREVGGVKNKKQKVIVLGVVLDNVLIILFEGYQKKNLKKYAN
jgi:hypothetical protein